MPRREQLAVMLAYTGDGGVEKMVNHLLAGFVAAGVPVDLLMLKSRGGHARTIPQGVRVIDMSVATSLQALPALYRYLRRERPRALLVAKDRAGRVALLARRAAGVDTRVVLRMGMHLSGSLQGRNAVQKAARWWPVRCLYPMADAIVAVAQPIADDLSVNGRIPPDRFRVIPNPVIMPGLDALAAQPVDHPWLVPGHSEPVILAAGRLKAQKDFPTLLHALARLRQQKRARLVILGEGPDRQALLALRDHLELEDCVDFPGFQANPYQWMRAADVFVLSSRYEGSPNVLIEAMALGRPVVSTDCPGGSAELLRGGLLGPLVPVGDADALAHAILRALENPVPAADLRDAVRNYTLEHSSLAYLDVLGWPGAATTRVASGERAGMHD